MLRRLDNVANIGSWVWQGLARFSWGLIKMFGRQLQVHPAKPCPSSCNLTSSIFPFLSFPISSSSISDCLILLQPLSLTLFVCLFVGAYTHFSLFVQLVSSHLFLHFLSQLKSSVLSSCPFLFVSYPPPPNPIIHSLLARHDKTGLDKG